MPDILYKIFHNLKKCFPKIQESVSLPNFWEEKNLTAVDASMSKYLGKLGSGDSTTPY